MEISIFKLYNYSLFRMALTIDWYKHLVNQSRTDHIYDLIHGGLSADWDPGHALDFVVVRKRNLPAAYNGEVPPEDVSKKLRASEYCFPGEDYVLLNNRRLTEYLEAAKSMRPIMDFKDREFIELLFEYAEPERRARDNEPGQLFPDPYETTPEELEDSEEGLRIAYGLLVKGEDRELALRYAEVGKAFLDDNLIQVDSENDVLSEVCRQMMGYNIVAMVYAWNAKFDIAAKVDQMYIHNPLIWDELEETIRPYLEMLIAKKQVDYLQFLFKDTAFKERFLAHYEAFISLLVNPEFEWTLMNEIVPIINRVNNSMGRYL